MIGQRRPHRKDYDTLLADALWSWEKTQGHTPHGTDPSPPTCGPHFPLFQLPVALLCVVGWEGFREVSPAGGSPPLQDELEHWIKSLKGQSGPQNPSKENRSSTPSTGQVPRVFACWVLTYLSSVNPAHRPRGQGPSQNICLLVLCKSSSAHPLTPGTPPVHTRGWEEDSIGQGGARFSVPET